MSRAQVHPVFVDRKTAAEMLMISVETFDAWVRGGFLPQAHIDRGQIMRWHWPSLEALLAHLGDAPVHADPFMENIADVFGKKAKGRNRAAA
ncbi:hypothetical protein [Bosea sp. (in: a-proteobacteria)]|uniref:hypothetical protein n=1 Tax=Bosea sp. (in: a-proteobacteria) TaxID=1871050 RepID=UPI00261901A2|nr:hypothetical protein [Bosea sp. (in: a-proteobacteria)]MCO5092628.1 hypothetical protein [Bosea sp. (in: a-proteobacteria)]